MKTMKTTMKTKKSLSAWRNGLSLAVVFALAGPAQAGTLWNVADGDWNTATNWNPPTLPTAADAIIDNDGIARIAADFTTSKEVGIGYEGKGSIDLGTGGSGTLYQTAGTLDVNGGRFNLGNGDDVGVYYLEGGTLDASPADSIIGANNSSAPAASGIIQSGASNSKFKKMLIGDGWDERSDSGSTGYYEMNSSGTMEVLVYGLHIANAERDGATGQQGIFTQTAGTVTISGTHATAGVSMGLGAGNGGTAELHLNGGVFHNARGIFSFANGAFVDIAGGTLRLDNADNGGSTWDFTALTTKWEDSDFRSFGVAATAASLVFTDTGGGTTDITGIGLPDLFVLIIAPNGANYNFSWGSQVGKVYDLVSSIDLATPILDWDVYDDGVNPRYENIASGGTTTTLTAVAPTGTARFFAVVEKDLLEESFDAAAALPAGWTSSGPVNGTDWEAGTPTGGGVSAPTAASSGAYCAGTNIGGYYTENADVSLKSPPIAIPVGIGATLSFRQWIDTDLAGTPHDLGSVRILDAGTDTLIGTLELSDIEGDGSAGWTSETLDMTALDVGGMNIKVEFRFVSNAGTTPDSEVWSGFYIDDVVVKGTAP